MSKAHTDVMHNTVLGKKNKTKKQFHNFKMICSKTKYIHTSYIPLYRPVPYATLPNEPPHDRTNKIPCAPSEDSDQPGHLLLAWRTLGP